MLQLQNKIKKSSNSISTQASIVEWQLSILIQYLTVIPAPCWTQLCTKSEHPLYYDDIWFTMSKNLNYVVFFPSAHYFPSREGHTQECRDVVWKQTKTESVQWFLLPKHTATAASQPEVWTCVHVSVCECVWKKVRGSDRQDWIWFCNSTFIWQPLATVGGADH